MKQSSRLYNTGRSSLDTDKLTEQLLLVIQSTSKLSTQLDSVQSTMGDLMSRLEKVEDTGVKISLLEERVTNIDKQLRHGSEHFSKLDKEINALQDAEGDRAKETIKSIWNYVLVAILAGVISHSGDIISAIIK